MGYLWGRGSIAECECFKCGMIIVRSDEVEGVRQHAHMKVVDCLLQELEQEIVALDE